MPETPRMQRKRACRDTGKERPLAAGAGGGESWGIYDKVKKVLMRQLLLCAFSQPSSSSADLSTSLQRNANRSGDRPPSGSRRKAQAVNREWRRSKAIAEACTFRRGPRCRAAGRTGNFQGTIEVDTRGQDVISRALGGVPCGTTNLRTVYSAVQFLEASRAPSARAGGMPDYDWPRLKGILTVRTTGRRIACPPTGSPSSSSRDQTSRFFAD